MSGIPVDQVRADSLYIDQQLDVMAPDVIKEAYPERTYSKAFAQAKGMSPGMASITYRHARGVGVAKIVEGTSREIPLVGIDVSPVTVPVKLIRLGMEYTTEDVRQGQFTGMPLDREQFMFVMEGHYAKIDEVAWVGDTASSIYGLANHPNILRLATSVTFDSNSTPAQILAALNLMKAKQVSLTRGIERFNTLAISDEEYQYISSTPFSASGSGDTRTILEVYLAGDKDVDLVLPIHWLRAAGVGSTNMAIGFNRGSAKVEHLLAMAPVRQPTTLSGVVFLSVVESKTGGLAIHKPFSVIALEGI